MASPGKAIKRLKQGGGMRLLAAYAKMGLLPHVAKQCVKGLLKGKGYVEIYSGIRPKVEMRLAKQYLPLLKQLLNDTEGLKQEPGEKKVWACWLQGIDKAPELVRACLASQKRFLADRELVVTDLDNYAQYAELPDFVVEKYKKGIIPPALFTDLLRLELLIRHGGTWIDASVLLTGRLPEAMLDADLFMPQYLDPATGAFQGFSNWLIASCKNSRPLTILREMLYQYWRDYNCVTDYYIFHLFISLIVKKLKGELERMPKANSYDAIALERRLGLPYPQQETEQVMKRQCFHKLGFRLSDKVLQDPHNTYHYIIATYKE